MLTLTTESLPAVVGAWLVTYLVHSTLLLGLAWGASRALRRNTAGRALGAEEWIWRAAVLGGLLTASLQLAVGPWQPWRATSASPQPLAVSASLVPYRAAEPLAASPAVPRVLVVPAQPDAPSRAVPALAGTASLPWTTGLVALWAAGAAFFLAALALRWVSFRRRLATREPVEDGPLPAMLGRLVETARLRRGVRLSRTHRVPVPFARGIVRPEICLPERALTTLPPAQQESVLAHEMAHLVRRDPLWLTAQRLLEAVLFVQPLNRLAGRRLAELAEYRCDDWAAGATGRRRELARCLTAVAEWLLPGRRVLLPVPGMAASRSHLAKRVERLLGSADPAATASPPRWLPVAAGAVLALVFAFAPGVTLAGNAHRTPPAPPAPPAPPVAATAPAPPAPAVAPRPPVPPAPPAAPAALALPALAPPPVPPTPPSVPAPLAPPAPPAPVVWEEEALADAIEATEPVAALAPRAELGSEQWERLIEESVEKALAEAEAHRGAVSEATRKAIQDAVREAQRQVQVRLPELEASLRQAQDELAKHQEAMRQDIEAQVREARKRAEGQSLSREEQARLIARAQEEARRVIANAQKDIERARREVARSLERMRASAGEGTPEATPAPEAGEETPPPPR